ncbi:MAG: hypothetical protein RIQ94_449 [Pseudomonadota bacterium]|jgi:uncharacterized protein (DUF1499 family)
MTFKIFFYIIFMTFSTANQAISASEKTLPVCRDTPNCVSSQALDAKHFIEGFKINCNPAEAWKTLKEILNKQSRLVITHETTTSIHAEATSLVFRFVDDLDFIYNPQTNLIDVRSASRTGHSDFGVNRKRIETLRLQMQKAHVID